MGRVRRSAVDGSDTTTPSAATLRMAASASAPRGESDVTHLPEFLHAPFAAAMLRAGGQVVAFDRIPVTDVIAALEAAEDPEIES